MLGSQSSVLSLSFEDKICPGHLHNFLNDFTLFGGFGGIIIGIVSLSTFENSSKPSIWEVLNIFLLLSKLFRSSCTSLEEDFNKTGSALFAIMELKLKSFELLPKWSSLISSNAISFASVFKTFNCDENEDLLMKSVPSKVFPPLSEALKCSQSCSTFDLPQRSLSSISGFRRTHWDKTFRLMLLIETLTLESLCLLYNDPVNKKRADIKRASLALLCETSVLSNSSSLAVDGVGNVLLVSGEDTSITSISDSKRLLSLVAVELTSKLREFALSSQCPEIASLLLSSIVESNDNTVELVVVKSIFANDECQNNEYEYIKLLIFKIAYLLLDLLDYPLKLLRALIRIMESKSSQNKSNTLVALLIYVAIHLNIIDYETRSQVPFPVRRELLLINDATKENVKIRNSKA
uniref:Uncharacterized protein n=1 Tax=Glossina austeni TaxID=7395 RepID=A0A1A9VFR9_GLOAU